jgi:hypothetical protein
VILSIVYKVPLVINRLVEQDEYVVKYNTFTNTFDGVLTQGRFATALGTEFFHFKRVLQNIELFNIKCMSRDKVIINLHSVMQIQYDPRYLVSILLEQYDTEVHYKALLTAIIKSVILNTCLDWNVEQFYMERSKIDNSMYNKLIQNVNVTSLGTQLMFFQLVDIQFPVEYSDLIKEKQNVEQNIQTALNDRVNKLTQAQTIIVVNTKEASINLVNANKTANIRMNNADTVAKQIKVLWETRASTYENIKTHLNLSADGLMEYVKQEKIINSPGTIINIDKL